ncbi:hypothetical protein E4U43_005302 [Claviceps pusilla]|uniref:Uncharacterized protein n=1 Tax=Claviceps pusilla TaxID=123648 RepID=A0A9P7N4R0_9HYPO|nr:hypothetical protein E4U43_005302 [Claviceps pusilla]
MPTYLCHGFRWYRSSIRPFIILNDLDECAPDWIIEPTTAAVLLSQLAESFGFVPRLDEDGDGDRDKDEDKDEDKDKDKHDNKKRPGSQGRDTSRPQAAQQQQPARYDEEMTMPTSRVPPEQDRILMHDWSPVKLLEEYDENETEHAARPYAYMADHAVRVDLGADILAEMALYDETLKERNADWFERLREEVQPEEQTRWYIVVCDDTEREAPVEDEADEDEDEDKAEHEHDRARARAHHDDGDTVMGEDLSDPENGRAMAQLRLTDDGSGHVPPAAMAAAAPFFYENKALPCIPAQAQEHEHEHEHDRRAPAPEPPTFLDQDPFESRKQISGRILKKKMSLRRLFSKKEA